MLSLHVSRHTDVPAFPHLREGYGFLLLALSLNFAIIIRDPQGQGFPLGCVPIPYRIEHSHVFTGSVTISQG